jgi:glyoxylase-like metal-dependent hydrolase (beta-lactamase superfamily II)
VSDQGRVGFVEIAERCFVARYPEWDVNVGLVLGSAGALVVDTRASLGQGREVLSDVRRLDASAAVRWVVNTHEHFDHVFGNGVFHGAAIHAHENAARGIPESESHIKRLIRDDPSTDPAQPAITAEVLRDVLETEVRLPDVTFSSVAAIDLGDRVVELAHLGRGHTDGDIVIRVPDADVVFAGDLVEESGPPAFGEDSFPLDWPGSLDLLVGLIDESSVVVPGHGRPVDRDFVQAQRADVSDVAELIRALYGQRVPVDAALAEGEREGWPFPAGTLAAAVRRGYRQLDVGRRAGAGPSPGPDRTTLPLA